MKRMPTKMTIDDLAAIVRDEFVRFEKAFEDKLEEKLEEKLNYRFEEVKKEFTLVHRRFDELEEGKRSQDKEVEVCRHHRALTDARLTRLESAVS